MVFFEPSSKYLQDLKKEYDSNIEHTDIYRPHEEYNYEETIEIILAFCASVALPIFIIYQSIILLINL